MKKLTALASRAVFLDGDEREKLARRLSKAGLETSPEEFTARRIVIAAAGALGALACAGLKFWFGILLCALLTVLGLMKLRDSLQAKMKERDEEISLEMPVFIRAVCRNLRPQCFCTGNPSS